VGEFFVVCFRNADNDVGRDQFLQLFRRVHQSK
jgi:hypothetical protein